MRWGHITGVTAKGIAFRILDKDINLQPVRSERVKCKTNSVCNSHGRPERVVEDKVSTQNLQRALKVKQVIYLTYLKNMSVEMMANT